MNLSTFLSVVFLVLCTLGHGTTAALHPNCPIVNFESRCPQGCWHDYGSETFSDGSRQCESVGPGYYSPRNDDDRYPCAPGSFSNIETAASCGSCPAGTHAALSGMDECQVCPTGTYANMPRSIACFLCDPTFYSGDGANTFQVWNGNIYCVLSTPAPVATTMTEQLQNASTNPPTATPTLATPGPTVSHSDAPTPFSQQPSATPTTSPTLSTNAPSAPPNQAPSIAPTIKPNPSTPQVPGTASPTSASPTSDEDDTASESLTITPSVFPSTTILPTDLDGNSTIDALPFDKTSSSPSSCPDGEYKWHGNCRPCPSQLTALLHPLAMFMFVASVIILTSCGCLSTCCLGIFWLGLEYLQFLYLLGLVPLAWTAILQKTFGIISIFALDLDASFSLQCQIEIVPVSPMVEQVWILLLPILVWIILCAISKLLSTKGIPVTRWMTIGLYLGYAKLLLTSLEAIRCDDSNATTTSVWICREKLVVVIMGLFGLLGYGLIFPIWFLWKLRQSAMATKYNDEKKPRGCSQSSCWMYTTFPFQNTCWWWTGFWMIRKAIVVVLIAIFHNDSPSIVLTTLLVALMISEILQRSQQPTLSSRTTASTPNNDYGDDEPIQNKSTPKNHDNSYRHHLWFQTPNVDLTLQSCQILLTALSFVGFAISAEKGLVLGILFLILFVPSIIYWVLALLHCSCCSSCCCYCNDNDHPCNEEDEEKSIGSIAGSNEEFQMTPTTTAATAAAAVKDTKDMNKNSSTSKISNRSIQSTSSLSEEEEECPESPTPEPILMPSLSMVPQPGSADDYNDDDMDLEESTDADLERGGHTMDVVVEEECEDEYYSAAENAVASKDWERGSQDEETGTSSFVADLNIAPAFTTTSSSSSSNQQQQHHHQPAPSSASTQSSKNTLDRVVRGDNSDTMIFADDEDEISLSFEGDNKDDDDDKKSISSSSSSLEEIWIDEATGLPVDPNGGDWTDAKTGLCVTYGKDNGTDHSEKQEEYRRRTLDIKFHTNDGDEDDDDGVVHHGNLSGENVMVLEPCHRVEPFTWGKRQSAVYQPPPKYHHHHHNKP